MSFLRGSANYVWCTTSVLGKGATGAVFQGVNKHSGETVAVKTFNQLSHMRPHEVQVREFEVLQKVNHENIVKLLSIEEEQEGRGKVIVMELCTGGSLFNLLDDPENNFGLDEDEWLLVLSHLSAGMNHLRDNNLVHRDLKPGNIMKFIKDDGSIVYKLTDFGAARELQDDQQFVSLYGTEEYLHPDMYERAVLRKPVGKTFGATVDLWSIGVTLYHVATGSLPFRPFGGRRNKETMYYITTKKASGVISGVQTSENGPIQWSKDLPATCLLSAGIRRHVTPLLAGLLEVNPQKMWSFERFFSEVTRILSKKKLHFCFMNRMLELRVYLDRSERLENLQALLAEQTEVEPQHQVLLFQGKHLHSLLADPEATPGTSFPDTTGPDPVVLFSKENHNVALAPMASVVADRGGGEAPSTTGSTTTSAAVVPALPVPAFPALPNLVSVENDATLAKSACAVGYAYRRKIESYSRCCRITAHRAVPMLTEVLLRSLDSLSDLLERCRAVSKLVENQLSFFSSAHDAQLNVLGLLADLDDAAALEGPEGPKVAELADGGGVATSERATAGLEEHTAKLRDLVADEQAQFRQLQRQLGELAPAVEGLHRRNVREGLLAREWAQASRGVPELAPSAAKARTYVGKLKESWQHLLRDRASRTLTYNDEQFHILEKIKMQETMRVLQELLQSECSPALNRATDALADWYKVAQTTYLQAEILQKDLLSYRDDVDAFAVTLKQAQQDGYLQALAEATGRLLEQRDLRKRLLATQRQQEMLEQEQRRQQAAFEAAEARAAAVEAVAKAAALARSHPDGGGTSSHQRDDQQQQQRYCLRSNPATPGGLRSTKGTWLAASESKQIRKTLHSIIVTQDEVWGILRENTRLIEQFGQLAVVASSEAASANGHGVPGAMGNANGASSFEAAASALLADLEAGSRSGAAAVALDSKHF